MHPGVAVRRRRASGGFTASWGRRRASADEERGGPLADTHTHIPPPTPTHTHIHPCPSTSSHILAHLRTYMPTGPSDRPSEPHRADTQILSQHLLRQGGRARPPRLSQVTTMRMDSAEIPEQKRLEAASRGAERVRASGGTDTAPPVCCPHVALTPRTRRPSSAECGRLQAEICQSHATVVPT